MAQFNLDETTIRHGVRCIFGIAAGILAFMLMEIADDFLTGIIFGLGTGVVGVVLAIALRQVGVLPCLTLIPLGLVAILHGMDDGGFHPMGGYHRMHPLLDDLGEALLIAFAAGYFIYALVQGGRCLLSGMRQNQE